MAVSVSVQPRLGSTVKVKVREAEPPAAGRAPYDWGPLGERTPPVASSVATRSVVPAAPVFCRVNATETASPGSRPPVAGLQPSTVGVGFPTAARTGIGTRQRSPLVVAPSVTTSPAAEAAW